ncbi:MAG: sigma-70 family RNA polymerase sigma factor [Acidobacteria bacterium]|nr:MAG: sigma-70 family RNA polymerase sigma factor [Acidobacteriota bacterium]RPJ79993.1 MAG: sigma-70 family RNA polymerase sigma factor [Acidobacteriota bacterium]
MPATTLMNSGLSDEALLERYRAHAGEAGSEVWINELFSRHQRKVALWCLRMTSDRETALDLSQEVLARAFEKLDTFRGDSKFSTWLYTIARFHCLNHLRSTASKPKSEGEDPLEQIEDVNFRAAFEAIEARIDRREIWKVIQGALNETELKVMMLHYGHGIPLGRITSLLELDNASGAKAFIVSAKRRLEPALSRWKARTERQQRNRSVSHGDDQDV